MIKKIIDKLIHKTNDVWMHFYFKIAWCQHGQLGLSLIFLAFYGRVKTFLSMVLEVAYVDIVWEGRAKYHSRC